MNAITDIFRYTDSATLSVEEEVTLITDAQAGDEGATLLLLNAYGPALRNGVTRFMRRLPVEERGADRTEEAQAEALAAFMETLVSHDPEKSPRLAGRISQRLTDAFAEAARLDAAMNIPERTLSRFYGILREAEGDLTVARALASSKGMKETTFDDILAVVRETLSLTHEDHEGDEDGDRLLMAPLHSDVRSEYDEVEDAILIDIAFASVDDDEARVVEMAYGFRGTSDYAPGEPMPDSAIAGAIGGSRATVQRKRGKALGKMRKALGVTVEA